jgi:hypothetical protein
MQQLAILIQYSRVGFRGDGQNRILQEKANGFTVRGDVSVAVRSPQGNRGQQGSPDSRPLVLESALALRNWGQADHGFDCWAVIRLIAGCANSSTV